jgi:hypothetical protein
MALTELQRRICRVLAERRKRQGESYVAGGAALNELLGGARRSHDLDLFHDTQEALAATWDADREALASAGMIIEPIRVLPSYVEARVGDGGERELLQWAQDSAYRFFPLLEHDVFGLTLHPFDLATNKVLALVGRRKVRDWVDAIQCHQVLQPIGYLAWAAAGKDPGFSPSAIVEEAARVRYAQPELERLAFQGPAPSSAALSARWHAAIADARELVRVLPADEVGKCVLAPTGVPLTAGPEELAAALAAGRVRFHEGRIGGAFPELRDAR